MAIQERTTPNRAREILAEELDREGWDTASAFTIEDGARPSTERLEWWHENTPTNERSETKRNRAYLRAYVRIAQGQRLWAGGLKLSRRTLWIDRSIMSRLERDGYIEFIGSGTTPYFEVTARGQHWLSEG